MGSLHTLPTAKRERVQYLSSAYSQISSRFPWRRPFIYLNRHTPSSQSRVYRGTQVCTNGVHCRESAGAGPVVLKVVPVTGATILQVTMDQLMCASLFPHPLLVRSGHVENTGRYGYECEMWEFSDKKLLQYKEKMNALEVAHPAVLHPSSAALHLSSPPPTECVPHLSEIPPETILVQRTVFLLE